jgi:hypothetical protein
MYLPEQEQPPTSVFATVKSGDRLRCESLGSPNRSLRCVLTAGTKTLSTQSARGTATCTAVAPKAP